MTNQNAQLFALIGGAIVPILVGVLTKLQTSSQVKAIVNAALTAVTGALAQTQTHWNMKGFIFAWGTAWVVSVATHFGLYKPTGVSSVVQGATANFGLGAKVAA